MMLAIGGKSKAAISKITVESKMAEFVIEEKDDPIEAEMSFKGGKVSFLAGITHEGYFHTFSTENTKKLYEAMKKFYGD